MKIHSREKIIAQIEPILKKHKIKKAALFGSFARMDTNEQSDVDILVELPSGSTLLDLVGLRLELQNTLGRKVDVVTYNSINPYRKKHILQDVVPIHG